MGGEYDYTEKTNCCSIVYTGMACRHHEKHIVYTQQRQSSSYSYQQHLSCELGDVIGECVKPHRLTEFVCVCCRSTLEPHHSTHPVFIQEVIHLSKLHSPHTKYATAVVRTQVKIGLFYTIPGMRRVQEESTSIDYGYNNGSSSSMKGTTGKHHVRVCVICTSMY